MKENKKALVIKFGGSSATNAEGADREYLQSFLTSIEEYLSGFEKIGLIIGGGKRIRLLQETVATNYEKDMIAREAMWEHAETLREIAQEIGLDPVDQVPHSLEELKLLQTQEGRTVTSSWLKDGQSSDTSAILMAEMWLEEGYEALVVILSNVAHIYTADPKKDYLARPIAVSSVQNLVDEKVLSQDKFIPGMSVTIDPVAVSILTSLGDGAPSIFFGDSADVDGVASFLQGEDVESGTVLDPSIKETKYS